MKKVDLEETKKNLIDLEDFTVGYWEPALKEAEKNIKQNPSAPDIIREIIRTRRDYCAAMRRLYKLDTSGFEKYERTSY